MNKEEKLRTVEKFANLIELMYYSNILSSDEFNELVSLANKLQYSRR